MDVGHRAAILLHLQDRQGMHPMHVQPARYLRPRRTQDLLRDALPLAVVPERDGVSRRGHLDLGSPPATWLIAQPQLWSGLHPAMRIVSQGGELVGSGSISECLRLSSLLKREQVVRWRRIERQSDSNPHGSKFELPATGARSRRRIDTCTGPRDPHRRGQS